MRATCYSDGADAWGILQGAVFGVRRHRFTRRASKRVYHPLVSDSVTIGFNGNSGRHPFSVLPRPASMTDLADDEAP
jgi:hypothetical protein